MASKVAGSVTAKIILDGSEFIRTIQKIREEVVVTAETVSRTSSTMGSGFNKVSENIKRAASGSALSEFRANINKIGQAIKELSSVKSTLPVLEELASAEKRLAAAIAEEEKSMTRRTQRQREAAVAYDRENQAVRARHALLSALNIELEKAAKFEERNSAHIKENVAVSEAQAEVDRLSMEVKKAKASVDSQIASEIQKMIALDREDITVKVDKVQAYNLLRSILLEVTGLIDDESVISQANNTIKKEAVLVETQLGQRVQASINTRMRYIQSLNEERIFRKALDEALEVEASRTQRGIVLTKEESTAKKQLLSHLESLITHFNSLRISSDNLNNAETREINTTRTLGQTVQGFVNSKMAAVNASSELSTVLAEENTISRIAFSEYTNLTNAEKRRIAAMIEEEAIMNELNTTMQNSLSSQLARINQDNALARAERSAASAMENYLTIEEKFVATNKGVASSVASANSALASQTAAVRKATVGFTTLTDTVYLFRRALRFVASMYIWTIATEFIEVAKSAVTAKSEMESYFDQMGMTTYQIDNFNAALDNTVSRFQKVSKFSMGEAVASLGVEFELTTAQMTRLMDIVAMIQSEYVRAGRTQEEATLAVKDILQGEFTRLSRETGVGKEELKAAGWSGATTDILTLMDALDKVGKSRHWDTFAAKATSLNDVIVIMQNRFGELVAYLTSAVTPVVTGVFNVLMSAFSNLIDAFNGLPDFVQKAASLLLFVGALHAVGLGFIEAKSGLTLLEIGQLGYMNSLIAATFATDAESVAMVANIEITEANRAAIEADKAAIFARTAAQEGDLAAIMAKITGLSAATVNEIGYTNAIVASTLGLQTQNFEMAQAVFNTNNLSAALATSIVARSSGLSVMELENVALGVNNAIKAAGMDTLNGLNALTELNTLFNMNNTQSLFTGEAALIKMKIARQYGVKVTELDTAITNLNTLSKETNLSVEELLTTQKELHTLASSSLTTQLLANKFATDAVSEANFAQIVSEEGIFTAITASILSREGNTVAQSKNIAITEAMTGTTIAQTLAEAGLTGVTGLLTVAVEGLAAAIYSLPIIGQILLALTIAIAAAFAALTYEANKTAAEIEQFKDTVDNADSILNESKSAVDGYTERLNNLTEGTEEYNRVAALKAKAEANYNSTLETVRQAKSADAAMTNAMTDANTEFLYTTNDMINQVTKGYDDLSESQRTMLEMTMAGYGKEYKAVQAYVGALKQGKDQLTTFSQGLENNNLSAKRNSDLINEMAQEHQNYAEAVKRASEGDLWGNWDAFWAVMKMGWIDLWVACENAVAGVSNWLGSIWNSMVSIIMSNEDIRDFINWLWSIGGSIYSNLIKIWDAFTSNQEVIDFCNAVGNALQQIGGFLTWVGQGLLYVLQVAYDFLHIGDGLSAIWWGLTQIGGAISQLAHWIAAQDWLGNFLGMCTAISNALRDIYNFFVWAWNGISSFAGTAVVNVISILAKVVCILLGCSPGIVPALQKTYDTFVSVFNGIKSFIGPIVKPIVSAIKTIVDTINSFVNNPLGTIGNIAGNGASLILKVLGFGIDAYAFVYGWLYDNIITPILGFAANIFGYLSGIGLDGVSFIMQLLGFSSEQSTFVTTWLKTNVITPIQNFIADPVGAIGGAVANAGTWIWDILCDWTNSPVNQLFMTYVITPIVNEINLFLADPIGYVAGAIQNTGNWILKMLGVSDEDIQNNSFGQNLYKLIVSGLTYVLLNAPSIAYQVGVAVSQAIWNGLMSIPILGPILAFIAGIFGQSGNANSAGNSVGSNAHSGVISGMGDIAGEVLSEFKSIVDNIWSKVDDAKEAAAAVGEAIWDGINSFLQRSSPGFISKEVLKEFGTDIPNAILSGVNTVYTAASQYGQVMTQAMQSQMSNMSVSPSMDMGNTDMALAQYRADSQLANAITTDTTTQTTAAFVGMDATMGATFSNLGTTVATSLNGIKTNNNQAMNSVTDTTNKQLSNMRSSTQKVTTQMTNAWWSMKDNIVSAADQLQSQSSQRFNSLSTTIGNFYGKLQNPSRWGGPSNVHHAGNRSRLGRASAKMSSILNGGSSSGVRVAGGPSSRRGPVTGMMKIKDIIKQVCPEGNCFNLKGLDLNATVDVATFLQELVPNGGFGWYDWNSKHYEHIRRVSNEWDMEGPAIHAGGKNIATGTAFQVKEFENSTPKISFSSFQKMAEALFSAIPYDYYFNSEKYGSWQAALQAGACNCYDGANALLALARTCGFSGTMGHGTWNGIPHVFAIINGKKMDTTGWQNRRNWNGISAGGPSKSSSSSFGNTEKNVNLTINIDLSNAVVTDEKEFAEKVGDVAVKKIIDLTGVNPSTGR